MQAKIENSLRLLDKWIEENGWAGYDPYDIKEKNLIKKITEWGNKFRLAEIFREGLFELFLMFPNLNRKIFNVKPRVNAKAMGLFTVGYLDLYKIYGDENYLNKSIECLDWLDMNVSTGFLGKGWGYPFDWQAKELIVKNTPNGIVTTAAGDAYWKMYKFTGDEKYLKTCEDICVFLSFLPQTDFGQSKICFSYTPLFKNYVHNLNLFVAEFLIKVGLETNNTKWIELGKKAVNYTLECQMDNGSFDYNGPPEKSKNLIDNYHTGFILRMLYSIWQLTKVSKYKDSLDKCYSHYINNFFETDGLPKFTPQRKYRIDIHSSAEAMNCLAQLSPNYPEGINIALKVADWTIDNLQDERGYFYHGIFKSRITKKIFKSKIAYIRWGEAWMLKGLSNLIKYSGLYV